MCGIVAVLRRPSRREPPDPDELEISLAEGLAALDRGIEAMLGSEVVARVESAAARAAAVDGALRGVPGVRCLLEHPGLDLRLRATIDRLEALVSSLEGDLDAGAMVVEDPEAVNEALVALKDALWGIGRDRLRTADEVAALAGPQAGPAAIEAYTSVQVALSALDRLEVRGRDSAGLHVVVEGHALDLDDPWVRQRLRDREHDRLFTSGAVGFADVDRLALVYKRAAEIGELGENVRSLRAAITADDLLRRALAGEQARAVVVGHTRWASVGSISEANAHPLNQEEEGAAQDLPYVAAALNGDVDNHAELREREHLRVPDEVTTDAKVIPVLVSRAMAEGVTLNEAFRATVPRLEGSVAVACCAADDPGRVMLGLRGSGQGLYVGLAEDAFVVTSEPYGLVEETARYLRMDGERGGQVIALDAAEAGTLDGVERCGYDGTALAPSEEEVALASVTTRDIDRGDAPHFLLKEIAEAPRSFRKTLRSKVVEDEGALGVRLGSEALPGTLRRRLSDGAIRRVLVIGQGTAAVAGQAVAAAIDELSDDRLEVTALLATELSGFAMDDEMADTLVVAVSQSGTTTDTNRTVDLVRSRGAGVVGIVNRRNSDLVEKADGVLYTSDGRDVEMSVASTKAFYAQIAAGWLLAVALAETLGVPDDVGRQELLRGLRELPDAMEQVLQRRADIAAAAQRYAPSRRHWAVVGNGLNRVAAQEIRIKLSELCYKAIACDVTEDKKHIDLSSEPLILVCATGLDGPTADDVGKEVAIYDAHKAAPVVVATEGQARFPAAAHVIEVPEVHPLLAFVLCTMVGHLFGYEAALAIDAQAVVLRQARAAVELAVAALGDGGGADQVLERLRTELEPASTRFLDGLRTGAYDGTLEASTAVRLVSMLRYATGVLPLEAYALEHGKVGTPGVVIEDLTEALTRGIDELTRPIDAIKHQAKTVTVGISRSEQALWEAPLVQAVLAAGAAGDRLSYRTLRALQALEPAVAEVTGHTLYRVEGDIEAGIATIHVVDKGGVAAELVSRAERDPRLTGIKHRAAFEREVTAARGARDGRTLVIVPETKDGQATGLTLLHVRYRDHLPAAEAKAVLRGYRGRYDALRDAVTETEPAFDDTVLERLPLVDLLTEPVHVLARNWRSS